MDCPRGRRGYLEAAGSDFRAIRASKRECGLTLRVLRGGSWNNDATNLRAAARNGNQLDDRNDNIGFRVARDVERSHVGGFVAGAAAITVAAGVQFHFRIAVPAPAGRRPASNIKTAPVLW